MLPITMILARRIPQSLNSIVLAAALSIGGIAAFPGPSSALSPMASAALVSQGKTAAGDVVEIRVGAAPAPGMCWYYTDPSRTQGFWDYCQ
jgi:hypothetical protein